jgi:hypothetical protein
MPPDSPLMASRAAFHHNQAVRVIRETGLDGILGDPVFQVRQFLRVPGLGPKQGRTPAGLPEKGRPATAAIF